MSSRVGKLLLGTGVLWSTGYYSWRYVSARKVVWYLPDRSEPSILEGVPMTWSLSYYSGPYRHLVYVEDTPERYDERLAVADHSERIWGNDSTVQVGNRTLRDGMASVESEYG
jgi:hypothetical protein